MANIPNWVSCDLFVEGNRDFIKDFQKFAKSDKKVIDENNFIPYPREFAKKDEIDRDEEARGIPHDKRTYNKDGFNSGGYEWALNNWGTKWGLCQVQLIREYGKGKKLKYYFDTAWSPPIPIIKAMSEKYHMLKFKLKYFEGGNGFKGRIVFIAGKGNRKDKDYTGRRGG